MSQQRSLGLLFSRLTWPSVLVRERACVEIAHLLLDDKLSSVTREFFLKWLSSLHHESVCGLAVLVLLRAQADSDGDRVIPASAVRAALPFPSIQSELLLEEYHPGEGNRIELSHSHSRTPATDFSPASFFRKYVEAYLPPIYHLRAREIEERFGCPGFLRQWAYEWDIVQRRHPLELSTDPLDFWLGRKSSDDRYMGADMPLSEVYRSAYLRALAWAIEDGGLEPGIAAMLTAETVPINLDLWGIRPLQRPAWWPRGEEGESVVETAPSEVWGAVKNLWELQQTGCAPWGSDWCLAEAAGHVQRGRTLYDLSILSCFQRRFGAGRPAPTEMCDWCRKHQSIEVVPTTDSYFRFRGRIEPSDPRKVSREFEGSSFLRASRRLEAGFSGQRWQWWRDMRGVWAPEPALSPNGFEMRCESDALTFLSGGEVMARWCDWTEALRERLSRGLKPATGQFLLIRRPLLEQFLADTRSVFCWFARLTGSFQQHGYGEYKHYAQEQAFGISGVILPS